MSHIILKPIAIIPMFLSMYIPKTYAQSPIDPKAAAAIVNGDVITVGQFYTRLENLRFADFVANVNPLITKPDTGGQIALSSLISGKLVLQYAKKIGVMPTEAEVNTEFDNAKNRPDIVAAMEKKKFTEAQIKEDIIMQRAFYNVITLNITLSPEEIKSYYDRHIELQGRPDEWKVQGIRVTGKAAIDAVHKALASGMTFEKAASQFSEDPTTRSKNGDLGTIRATDAGIPIPMRQVLSTLKVGEVSQPVVLQDGGPPEKQLVLILKLMSKIEGEHLPLAKVREKVEHDALYEKSGGGVKKLQELRKEAKVEIKLPNYDELASKP